jgi:hypothetical protein
MFEDSPMLPGLPSLPPGRWTIGDSGRVAKRERDRLDTSWLAREA